MAEAMLNPRYRAGSIPELTPLAPPPSLHIKPDVAEWRRERSEGPAKSESRTVVINVPPKRPRPSPAIMTKKVIEGINSCVGRQDRIAAIEDACSAFDHGMEYVHDEEIASGADSALTKHLAFLLYKRCKDGERVRRYNSSNDDERDQHSSTDAASRVGRFDDEISRTCEALEMVFRCSANSLTISFNRVGLELLPLLVHVIDEELRLRTCCVVQNNRLSHGVRKMFRPEKCSSSSIDTDEDNSFRGENEMEDKSANYSTLQRNSTCPSEEGDSLLRKATKILGHFASIAVATKPLAYHKGLLSSLRRVIETKSDMIPSGAQLNSLWIIANLACNVENMVMMVCTGLLNTLVQASQAPTDVSKHEGETIEFLRARSIAARAMLNLSWAPENKISMSEHVNLIASLAKTLTTRTSSLSGKGRGVSAILLQSRRHAAGTLRNLAAAPRKNKIWLCQHKDGMLLEALSDSARRDPDSGVRDRAFAAMYNLACVETAEIMINTPSLLDALTRATASGDESEDGTNQSKVLASQTLSLLEESITPEMGCCETLRAAVEKSPDSTDGVDSDASERSSQRSDRVLSNTSRT